MAVSAPGFAPEHFAAGGNQPYEVENNLFKYHAACYLTHSTIEALNDIRKQHGIGLDDVEKLTIFMPPNNRKQAMLPESSSIKLTLGSTLRVTASGTWDSSPRSA